ncbi:hypothetical protein NE237_031306 [Protea cynaroides]|uniref:Bromo domain-containing protein n=1 Tax=Protea cynaroides TaxID=273540 RepID=A0A9Q0L204_9MAGN|nr:hypothetical protein NE237_031306 [Protea cynaroides]
MGKINMAMKKKGRSSKNDIGRRTVPDEPSESELRRSLRRRNSTYHDDIYEDNEEEDDEDERREKKLKLVLKLAHKADFGSGGGVDSSPNLIRTDGNVAHAALSASDDEYGDGNKPFKKRKIDGDGDNAHCYGEDDVQSIGSDHRNKERRRNLDIKGMASAPGTPSGSSAGLSLPDKKSLELMLDKLQKKDTYGVYAEPVDPEELPDYHDVIKYPMDFGTLRKKLANGEYSTLEQLESDVFLICSNAMEYNAPETIYFKQARSIQELARKKFQRLRIHIERNEKELKSEQKTKSNSSMKKAMKKPSCRTMQEPVGSDFSSGATLATTGDPCTRSNVTQDGGCDKPNNTDGLVNGNSSLNDNKPEKTEEQYSGKGLPSKFGRKSFVFDENRRATYDLSNQPVVKMDSIFTTFEGESKQLAAVGLHADHSHARSLVRFAASLGPVAWKVASRKIEQSLPTGLKFGRGWVGAYEPLPTPMLMLDRNTRKQLDYGANLNGTADTRKEDKNAEVLKAMQGDANPGFKTQNLSKMAAGSKAEEHAKVGPVSRLPLDGKLFGVAGTGPIIGSPCQQQKLVSITKSDSNVFKKTESNSSSASGNPSEIAPQKQFDYSFEMTTSRLLDMVSRNRNLVQSVPAKQKEANGVAAGGLPSGKAVSGSLDVNKVNGSTPDFVSNLHTREVTYFPNGNQEQGFSDPVLLMRMLAKTQNQQKSSNHNSVSAPQAMPSNPSLRRDDSNAASITAARSWMSIGTAEFKSTESVGPDKMQIAAASLYNPAREDSPVSRFCEESPGSGGLQAQQEKNKFTPQAFLPQPVRFGDEPQCQNNRPVVFPQLLTDLSRFQMQPSWRGLVPHTQPKQKQDTLPPDLNIGFQSSGSPVRQSSGILVDSQQPDLALQL